MTRRVIRSSPGMDPSLASALDERLCGPGGPDAEMLARVQARIMSRIRAEAASALHTVSAAFDTWEEIAPGVLRKTLWVSGGARCCMIRMAPGSVVGSHAHLIDEECVVLEGTLRIGRNLVLHAGDFHVGRSGSNHEEASTETGALVYLRGAV